MINDPFKRPVESSHVVYYAGNVNGQQLSPDCFTYMRAHFYTAHLALLNPMQRYFVFEQHPRYKTPEYTEGNQ